MAAESKLRKLLKARVVAYGGTIRAVSWLGRRNAPDVLALFHDRSLYVARYGVTFLHVFVETKGTEKLSEAQAREHKEMRAAGCSVMVCRNEAELDAWLPPL